MAEFGTNDSGSRAALGIAIDVVQPDSANNRTLIRRTVYVRDNAPSLGGYGTGSWSVSGIASGTVPYDFTGNSGASYTLWQSTDWFGHDASGRLSVSVAASFVGSSPVGSASGTYTVDSSSGLPDYARPPLAPSAPVLTRSANGASISIAGQSADGQGLSVTDYHWAYSTDNASWSAEQPMGTGLAATLTATSTLGYYVITRGYSSEGWGAWSPAAFVGGVPGVPASVSVARTGRDVTVTAGTASGSVSSYMVEYSTDGGTTWVNTQTMSGQSYTYPSLTPGVTYVFRVYAINSVGYSAKLASTGLYVPAGGYVWSSSGAETTAQAYMWDGAREVPIVTAVYWDGVKETALS